MAMPGAPVIVDIATLQKARARLRVLQGGALEQRAFEEQRPSRLLVGSAVGADLCFDRDDVAPRQFDIIWDGSQLWLQDGLRLGRTFVNGRTLNEWFPIVGQVIVCFGGVRVWMSSRAAPPRDAAPDFEALDRARLTEAHQSRRMRLSETGRITLPPEFSALNARDAQ
jgi:hypothetical protein